MTFLSIGAGLLTDYLNRRARKNEEKVNTELEMVIERNDLQRYMISYRSNRFTTQEEIKEVLDKVYSSEDCGKFLRLKLVQ